MWTKAILQTLVGIKNIVVKAIYFDAEAIALVIAARTTKKGLCRCRMYHRKTPHYDAGWRTRRWCAIMGIGDCKAFVEPPTHCDCCKKRGVVVTNVPWARHDTRFCRSLEERVAWLTTHTSHTVVSELIRVELHMLEDICDRVYKELNAAEFSTHSTKASNVAQYFILSDNPIRR